MLALHVDPKLIDPDRYQIVGLVSTIVSSSVAFGGRLEKLIVEEVVPAFRHGCIKVFYDMDHVPVGFITWAWLCPETEERVLRTMDPWIHLSEWVEGGSLWVRCFFVPPQQRMRAISLCMRELFPDVARARTLVVRKGLMMALEFDREYLSRLTSKAANRWAMT